jgi:hypothetical protein
MSMTMKKKIMLSSVAVIVLGSASFLFFGINKSSDKNDLPKSKLSEGQL